MAILKCKGLNGTIVAYEDRIVIERSGFGAVMTQGVRGDKTIYYSDILSISYRSPGAFSNGYIQFVTAGNSKPVPVPIVPTMKEARAFASDENTVSLGNKAEADAMNEFIMKQIESIKHANSSAAPISGADEILKYKQLLDIGVLTADEFEAKKKQILGI